MNLDWWNLFYEVAISKNISKASKKLNISQPAITNQIKKLEEHLNCKLFFRSQKGVFLTPAGELIFNDIKNGLNAFDMAEKKLTDNTKNLKTTIRIGISTTLTKTYLMKYIKAFHKKYNEVIFEISTDPTMMLKEELKKGKIDFIVAKFPFKINDEFSYIKIGEMQDIFIINKDYKKWKIKRKNGNYYYKNKRVRVFADIKPDKSFLQFSYDKKGTVDIKITRNKNGYIKNIKYLSKEEADEFLDGYF